MNLPSNTTGRDSTELHQASVGPIVDENIHIHLDEVEDETREHLERWMKRLKNIDARTLELPAGLSQKLGINNRWTRFVRTQEGITEVINNQRGLIATIQYAEGHF